MRSTSILRTFRTSLQGLALLAIVLAPVVVQGFVLRTDDSEVYVVKWLKPQVELDIMLSTTSNLSDGSSLRATVESAAAKWNNVIGATRLVSRTDASTSGDRTEANGINEVVIADTINGDAFPANVLAITQSYGQGNQNTEADIVFRADNPWDAYTTPWDPRKPDIGRVALHELGHVLGLLHVNLQGSNQDAIMEANVSWVTSLQSDDIAGARALYGAAGATVPNDAFASATVLELPANQLINAYGSTILASRETNEPAHGGIAQGHSIWWSWTAPADYRLTANTRGSDFDTILAVYTGDNVSSLSLVTENDDEETPEQNPEPSRRRTSLVAWNARAGATYHLAVDGWGGTSSPQGYTGNVKLRVQAAAPYYAPRITEHPVSVSARTGDVVFLRFRFSANPGKDNAVWQRLPAGSTTWVDLEPGGIYAVQESFDAIELRVETRSWMNGDSYRGRINNSEGTTFTDLATLTLEPIPLPVIEQQPVGGTFSDEQTLRLTASASSPARLFYQWFHNDQPIADAIESFLELTGLTAANSGTYHVAISNAQGTVLSERVAVQIISPPFVALNHGTRLRPAATEPLSLSARVTSSAPSGLTYQWFHDHRPVPGANQTQLNLPTSSAAQRPGVYWLRATDAIGTRDSTPIFVLPPSRPATRLVAAGDLTSSVAQFPPGLQSITDLALTYNTAIALLPDGTTKSWGEVAFINDLPPDSPPVVAISLRRFGALYLRADGTVHGNGEFFHVPTGLKKVTQIATSDGVAYALLTDGSIVSWDRRGTLNLNGTSLSGSDFTAIAGGNLHAVALRRDGSVVSSSGYAENAHYGDSPYPSNVKAIAAGVHHTVALHTDGSLSAWSTQPTDAIKIPANLPPAVEISAGQGLSMARFADGRVAVWGGPPFSTTPLYLNAPNAYAIRSGRQFAVAMVEVEPSTISRIVNLSVRSTSRSGDQALVVGFVIAGTGSQQVLVRGIGPALRDFDVPGVLDDPRLTLFNAAANSIGSNQFWSSDEVRLNEYFSILGAFPLKHNSKDAALIADLTPGSYSAHLVGTTPADEGIALVELYDASQAPDAQLSNVSARTVVGTGAQVLVAGFVVQGEDPKTLLIRGIGPRLADFGLPANSVLSNPLLRVFRGSDIIAENDNWNDTSAMAAATRQVGAFALRVGGLDAALLVTLQPGAYSVQVSGVGGSTGIGLIEVYDVE